jgi:predicted dehydrogenase
VSVVTPTKYFKEVVVACAEAGVKGISVEKPLGGVLSDIDKMLSVCES